ncbi:IPT/TIG domain-containing protein [Dictyostelium discoideum AX4]|uniref:IPT/TIG domain-containing protein n=1 Tax=Dictyostelium discoideum TaxID=44689 RepID=C7G006_DICDI|nr:IPT/TIG domain-containing protein [Dictyostelium discoideum AX4]EEU04116.1 IPT/TIG domain-containing protein [Dictyostelium discoideum AX4]|eukprot:XP_002649168.1 IPT/TIG domain-containing protein [Dictyostelium discoideum AX4]
MSNSDNFSFDSFRLSQSIDLTGFANQYGLNNSVSNVNNRYNLTSFSEFSHQLELEQQQNNHHHHHHHHQQLPPQPQPSTQHHQQLLIQAQQLLQQQQATQQAELLQQQQAAQLQQLLQTQQQQQAQQQAAIAAQQQQQQNELLLQQQQQQQKLQQEQNEIQRLQQQIQQMEQTFITGDINTELTELLSNLETLAHESIQHLFFLCKVLQPHLTEELRFPLLSKMFSDMPQMIPLLSIANHSTYLQDPNNHAFKLFMDFKELANLLCKISYLQLFHLTNNIIPPGSPQFQFNFFLNVQEYFRLASFDRLRIFNQSLGGDQSLSNTYLHIQKIMSLDSSIPIDIIHFVAGIISLPLSDLYLFHHWFSNLSKKLLAVLLALLQLDSSTVLDLKRILATSVTFTNENNNNKNNNILNNTIIPQNKLNDNNSNNNSSNNISLPMPIYNGNNNNNNNSNINSINNNNNNNNINNISVEIPTSPVQSNNNNFENSSAPSSPFINNYKEPLSPIMSVPSTPNLTTPVSKSSSQPTQTPQRQLAITPNNNNNNNNPSDCFYLKIARQPPPKTVYQRILKPFPQVMICGPGVDTENFSNFYVEVTLLRNDNQTELVNYIDGTKTSRITGGFAPFKKLKILSTTQQLRTLFRLKFVLKKYISNESQTFPEATVLSDPIEVFSHTIYLIDKQDVPFPPTVSEIIPASAKARTRVVILGSNFSNTGDLKVYFGSTSVTATFYEQGTIICQVPPNAPNQPSNVNIKVSNDGSQCSESKGMFNNIP